MPHFGGICILIILFFISFFICLVIFLMDILNSIIETESSFCAWNEHTFSSVRLLVTWAWSLLLAWLDPVHGRLKISLALPCV